MQMRVKKVLQNPFYIFMQQENLYHFLDMLHYVSVSFIILYISVQIIFMFLETVR